MPWPVPVVHEFAQVPTNPSEADFHGPYNKLLYTVFPADGPFTVVPVYIPGSRELAPPLVFFEVTVERKPVLILLLKSPSDLRYRSQRKAADKEIRVRIEDLIEYWHIPTLYAVSAMGTRLCFFSKQPGQPIVPITPLSSIDETKTVPEEHWSYDILEEEGEQKFRAMVEETQQAYAAL
ncbi:uncharacterized protein EI90DRAFT_3031220 [Cantharellus anzutake]|uniref:uncharacterized protein n=1 Tax=Cantharellus anzutake TaxID=1750568 RepID=UPI001903441A|nr:uncharacterized protein EI90DRAFT_3071042 [Cantharellus anzutake]XP_038923502.1 uncharacterized protein EI90DRAFT_3031220 [Cantharellus anzutake]KAF8326229.1 hypothetical protein EI90DRAFT_3071042 [Cantharellus anzutake]KAF8343057.1 hypothetical protein EI90DRAFT_3031220 [Cantharellus anzutake]